jgi:pimeloyl-ACP methyl ester carboxylesterase
MPSVRTTGVEIHYEVTGDGPPVVLGHSLLCSGEMWRCQVPALARGHRVVNVDARGHGASGPATARFTLYDSLADHLAVLDALKVERAVWIGLSQGGMVALRAALTAPERVAALVLLDTDGGRETLPTRVQHALLGAVARTVGIRPVLPEILKLMFGATTRRDDPDLVAEWSRRFAALDVPSVLNALGAVSRRDDLLPRVGQISAPALVLVGAEDAALPPARARRLAAALRGARIVEIPRAGHLSALEQPDAVTAELLAFLEGLAPEARASPVPP